MASSRAPSSPSSGFELIEDIFVGSLLRGFSKNLTGRA
jgi:hypothetical protein